jgi:hypothetical protein
MDSDPEILVSGLSRLGVVLKRFDKANDPDLFDDQTLMVAIATGGPLGIARALLKATNEVCNVRAWLTIPKDATLPQRSLINESLLRMIFGVPFGRVSLASYLVSKGGSDKNHVVFIETMFFWRGVNSCADLFKIEATQRLSGLVKLNQSVHAMVAKVMGGDMTPHPLEDPQRVTGLS